MTELQFRSSPERIGHLRGLLSDPVLAQAIVVLKDAEQPEDTPDSADPVASVRALSRKSGWHAAINMLLSLAEPLPVVVPDEEPTYGIDKSKFISESQSILR